jgi:hypothetical protein
MTIDHPLRRALARLCSADTMARVVDPILADVRWERHSAWRAGAIVLRALIVQGIMSAPGTLRRLVSDDDFALPRMALLTLAASVALSGPAIAPMWHGPEALATVLLVPQSVAWAIPAALLLAVPLALRGRLPDRRLTRRTMAAAAVIAACGAVLVFWIAPLSLARYDAILAPFLQGVAVSSSEFPNWSASAPARLLDYQYHQRLAFGSAALPFAMLGLGLSTLAVMRRQPWLVGSLAACAWMFAGFPVTLWISAECLRASGVPPAAIAWTPSLLIFGVGTALLTREWSTRTAR